MAAPRRRPRYAVVGVAMLLLTAAQAHHSAAMFDLKQCKSLSGTVRAVEWNYPHSWLWLNVNNGTGTTDAWGFESGSPAELMRIPGWSRTLVKPGDKLTVTYSPMRDGRKGGQLSELKLPDGRSIVGGAGFACNGATLSLERRKALGLVP